MDSGSEAIPRLEQKFIFLNICSIDNKNKVVKKLETAGFKPEIRPIIGGDLDGKYDILLPLTHYILYSYAKVDRIYHGVPLGKAYVGLWEGAASYAKEQALSEHVVSNFEQNIATVKEYEEILNHKELKDIKKLKEIEDAYFAPDDENSNKSFTQSSHPETRERKYTLEDIEKIQVIMLRNYKDKKSKEEILEYKKEGYCPKTIPVVRPVGDGLQAAEYVSIPFYAYLKFMRDLYIEKGFQEIDAPLGDKVMWISDFLCSTQIDSVLKASFSVVRDAVSDNLEHFNAFKLRDADKLFEEWQKKQKGKQRDK